MQEPDDKNRARRMPSDPTADPSKLGSSKRTRLNARQAPREISIAVGIHHVLLAPVPSSIRTSASHSQAIQSACDEVGVEDDGPDGMYNMAIQNKPSFS